MTWPVYCLFLLLVINFSSFCSYLRPANVGEEITINAEVIKMGQTFAFSSAELLNKDGKLLAKGSNTKYLGQDAPSVKKGVSF